MKVFREACDFDVLMESFSIGAVAHDIIGRRGEDIHVGDVLVTLYKGRPERWVMRAIERPASRLWTASVVPEGPETTEATAEVIPFPGPVRPTLRPALPPTPRAF